MIWPLWPPVVGEKEKGVEGGKGRKFGGERDGGREAQERGRKGRGRLKSEKAEGLEGEGEGRKRMWG